MYGRLMLAAIDWNTISRTAKLDKDGKRLQSMQYSKRRKQFVLKNVYKKTKANIMQEMVKRVHSLHSTKTELSPLKKPCWFTTQCRPGRKARKTIIKCVRILLVSINEMATDCESSAYY